MTGGYGTENLPYYYKCGVQNLRFSLEDMFTIDIIVKNTAVSLSVERKSEEDAQAVYQQVFDAIKSGSPQLLELTCEKIPDKKVAILSSEISAVQISQKSGASPEGRRPGFVSLAQ